MGKGLEILKGLECGQIAAILNKVSGRDPEKLQMILRDEVNIQLALKLPKLFDDRGIREISCSKTTRCEPDPDLKVKHPFVNTLDDYSERLWRYESVFVGRSTMPSVKFQEIAQGLIGEIANDLRFDNLINGPFFPLIIPMIKEPFDYGDVIERLLLPAVKMAFEKQFKTKSFESRMGGDLCGQISVIKESRHRKLCHVIRRETIVALYFPLALNGYSALAAVEQMDTLPRSLILSGGIDTLIAMAMYPDILAVNEYVPVFRMPALKHENTNTMSLYTSGSKLAFDESSEKSARDAISSCTSGLLYMGK